MLEAITTTVRPDPIFADEELLTLCDAYYGQLAECHTALGGATSFVESWTGQSLLTQTKRVVYSAWPALGLELPQGPVASVTSVSARVDDADTALASGTDYRFSASLNPPRLILMDAAPTIDQTEDAITVTYQAGVASRSLLDGALSSAVERLTKHLFEHPGDTEGDFFRAIKNYLRPVRIANINGVR